MTSTNPAGDASVDASRRSPTFGMKGRLFSAIGSNALSSLGNLSLTIAVARQVSTAEFGRFALVLLVYVLVTGLLRSSVLESTLARERSRDSEQMGLLEVGIYSTFLGLVLLAAGLVIGDPYLLILAVSLPGLVAFDYIKVLWLARVDARRSLLIELCWTLLTVGASASSIAGLVGPKFVFVIWAISPSIIAVTAIVTFAPMAIRWPKRQGRPSYAIDYLIGSGSTPAAMNILAAMFGPSIVGVIRAAATPMSPIHIIAAAIRPLAIAWVGANSDSRPIVVLKACMATCLALIPYVIVVMLIPDPLGTAILGETWPKAKVVLLPLGVEAILGVANSIGFAGHRGLRAARRVLLIRLAMATLRVGTLLPAAALWGVQGAAWSLPISSSVGVTLWWISWASIIRKREQQVAV